MINLSTIDNPNYGKYIGGIDGKENILYQNVKVRIYKIVRRLDLAEGNMIKYLGNWSLTQNISTFYGSLTVDVYLLKTYRVVTIIQPPFTQWGKHESGDLFLEGYCIDLLSFIQNDLKINVELYLDEEGRFGSIDENGVWNGVVGDLVIGNADFAISPLSVMAERETDIDYTVPYYDLVGTAILMKKTVVDNSLFKFLQVLEWPVWLAILCAYVLTSLLLWLFDRISPYSYTNMIKKNNEMLVRRQFSMKECFWFCMTSLTPQGGGEVPLNISGRFISATWWVFGFIIIATYTANLAAFLTVSRLEQPISSLDDLANQYKIEYAPIKGGSSELYFRRMAAIEQKFYNIWKEMSLNESLNTMDRARLAVWDYPVSDKFSNLWKIMQESKLPENTEKAIERVLTSENGFAFIGDAMEIRYAVLTNCDLQQIGQEFSRKPYALGVQANHPLKDKLSTSILRLLNQRKLEFLKEKWWVQNPQKAQCTTSDGDANGITIENIGGVFIVIFVGIVLSIIMLIIEFYYHHHKQATIKRVNTTQSQGAMQISHSDYSTTSNIPNSPVTEEVEVMQLETLTLRRNTIQVIEEVTKF
uniref:PBPe domain-containing protein n=1 Tax=Rhabditophanes sp. KR3021 TaxID=114890 RepID=A0AC35U534_9BILA